MTAALPSGVRLPAVDAGVLPAVVDVAGRVLESLPRADFTVRLEIRRRTRELIELAKEEGIKLPMPAGWIAKLELHGYVVDLETGSFGLLHDDDRPVRASLEAWALRSDGAA